MATEWVRPSAGTWRSFVQDARGATLVEYTVLIGLLASGVLIATQFVGPWVEESWEELSDALDECGKLPDQSQGQGCAEGRDK